MGKMVHKMRFLMFLAGLGILIVGILITLSPQLPDWPSDTLASHEIVRSAVNSGFDNVDAQLRSQHPTKKAVDFRVISIILSRRG